MPGLLPEVDPNGLLEYSVVYTDRALNHMSQAFQVVMTDTADRLNNCYGAAASALIPGSGTFAMEAVARQFATSKSCLIIRNGFFSYRWSQILEAGSIPTNTTILKARRKVAGIQEPFSPPPIDEALTTIRREKPDIVFAPHVETASGIMLPDEYIKELANEAHAQNSLLVLDCIASGAIWTNMSELGIDVLITAPQKGWSASPCCGAVMFSPLAIEVMNNTHSTSFACDLRKWRQIMEAYEKGGHAYHTTMPTDGIRTFHSSIKETENFGLAEAKESQMKLGEKVRNLLIEHGFPSVAASDFQAPGVVVSYTSNPEIQSGEAFGNLGLQTAAGVPLQCDEGDDYRSFRIGLFGLEKLRDHERTITPLRSALQQLS